jgi:hypothetical protein
LGLVIKVGNLSAWTTPHNQEAQYDHPPRRRRPQGS